VQEQAEKEYPNNTWKQREYADANPFPKKLGCSYVVVGLFTKQLGYHVAHGRSSIMHCQVCTTAGGKVKLQELLSSESFVRSIRAHGGRASEKVLRAEAGKLGLGGDAATADLFWRANARIRGEENGQSDNKWRAFPLYMQRLASTSDVFCKTWLDGHGVFKGAFILMYPAYAVIKAIGRPVCSTDMGHFKNDIFEGTNATGSYNYSFYAIFIILKYLTDMYM
jgi:hypothetical protein